MVSFSGFPGATGVALRPLAARAGYLVARQRAGVWAVFATKGSASGRLGGKIVVRQPKPEPFLCRWPKPEPFVARTAQTRTLAALLVLEVGELLPARAFGGGAVLQYEVRRRALVRVGDGSACLAARHKQRGGECVGCG